MPTWKERSVCAGLRQAAVAMETNQPHSRLFPAALIIRWLMKPSGEALSLCLWKPSKWAHYDKSGSKRKWLHTFSTHPHIRFLSLLLPKGEENKNTLASERNSWGASRYDNRGEVAPKKGSKENAPAVHHRECSTGRMVTASGAYTCPA